MRVVSWNMGHSKRSWDYLAVMNPDLALLQEANFGTQPSSVQETWPDQVRWPAASWGWGSAILAKPELNLTASGTRADEVPEGMEIGGWLATGVITLPDGSPMLVGSVHAPPLRVTPEHLAGRDPRTLTLPRYRVPRYFDLAYVTLRDRIDGMRFVVGGDWNVSPGLWRLYHPTTHDEDFFMRAADDGWVDCYRRDHKHEGHTWYRPGNLPYQFDHVFCDQGSAESMRSCEIVAHPASCEGISDHAPLSLVFDLS